MLNFDLLAAFDVNRLQGAFFFLQVEVVGDVPGAASIPPFYVVCVIFSSYRSLGCERLAFKELNMPVLLEYSSCFF